MNEGKQEFFLVWCGGNEGGWKKGWVKFLKKKKSSINIEKDHLSRVLLGIKT